MKIANAVALVGMVLVSLSTPTDAQHADLILTGTYDTSGKAVGVSVSGNYAYVADWDAGLQIIDISTPSSPSLLGTYDTSGDARGVAVSGNYAYVADRESGLQIIDISTPSSPSLLGTYDTSGNAWGVAVSGNYAYVADYGDGLQIIDISTPSNPSLVGAYDTSGKAHGVFVSDNYAYVADGGGGLQIIDISTPSSPSLLGAYDTSVNSIGVAVSGNYAYVADFESGLQIIDISTPSSPSLLVTYDTSGSARHVAVSGNYAYMADHTSGLQIIHSGLSTPDTTPTDAQHADLTLTGNYETDGDAWGVAVSGNYAYVADRESGLHIIDISTPGSPTLTATYDSPGIAICVAVSGNYAYVADAEGGLHILDISTPSMYSRVGTYDTSDWALGVAVSGNYAYVADHESGLHILDISSPSSPSLLGTYDTSGRAIDVAVSGNYAYVADNLSGLHILDISTPSSPSLLGTYDTSGYAVHVAVSGNYAYVADYESGLHILDISTPSSPNLLGTYDTSAIVRGVAVGGNYAYVADYESGLHILDISTPSSPSLLDTYDTSGRATDVAVSGNYAYVADRASGLQIIHSDISMPDTTPPTIVSIESSGSPGTYGRNKELSITVHFNEPVSFISDGIIELAGGRIIATLETGEIDREVDLWLGGANEDGLFTQANGKYTVQQGDYNSDLMVTSVATEGTSFVSDAAGNMVDNLVIEANLPSGYTVDAVPAEIHFDQFAYVGDEGSETVDGTTGRTFYLDLGGDNPPTPTVRYQVYATDNGLGTVEVKLSFKADHPGAGDIEFSHKSEGNVFEGTLEVTLDYYGAAGIGSAGSYELSRVQLWDSADNWREYTGDALVAELAAQGQTPGSMGFTISHDAGPPDTTPPNLSPSLLGTYDTSGNAWGVTVSGNYAYVADRTSGLQIIDISMPSSPSLVGTYDTSGDALFVAVSGNYAYVADRKSGLQIIDISTPSSPSLLGTYDTSGQAYGVAVSGNYAYVADYGDGLQIIDISTPSSPSLLGTYDTSGNSGGVAVSGNYAYVADDGDGLHIIDSGLPMPDTDPEPVADAQSVTVDESVHRLNTSHDITLTGGISGQGMTQVAGTSNTSGYSGDGGLATQALLNDPIDIALSRDGHIYIADSGNDAVRVIDNEGKISTITTTLPWVNSIAIDPVGIGGMPSNTLYIFDDNAQMRLESNGQITQPYNRGWGYFVFDRDGNRYVTDRYRVYRADANTPDSYTLIAGSGDWGETAGFSGDGGVATSASLATQTPRIWVDAGKNLYIADTRNHRIRKVNTAGVISTVAGDGSTQYTHGSSATSTGLQWPFAVVGDSNGTLYIANADVSSGTYDILKMSGGILTTYVGGLIYNTYPNSPSQEEGYEANMAIDGEGNLYVVSGNGVLKIGAGFVDGALTFSIVSWPENGRLWTDYDNDDWVGYVPNPTYHGSDRFTFTVTNDEGVTSDPATVEITVQQVNDHRELWAEAAYNRGDREEDLRQQDHDRVMASDDPAAEFQAIVRIPTIKEFGGPNDKLMSIVGGGAGIRVDVPSLDLSVQPLADGVGADVDYIEGYYLHPNGRALFVEGYDADDFMDVYKIDLSTGKASWAFDQTALNTVLNDSLSDLDVDVLSFNPAGNAVRFKAYHQSSGTSRLVEIPLNGGAPTRLWAGEGSIITVDNVGGRDRFIFRTDYDDEFGQGQTPWLHDLSTSTTTQLPDNLWICCQEPSNLKWISPDGNRSVAVNFATEDSPHYMVDLATSASEEISIPSASTWLGTDNEATNLPEQLANVDSISIEAKGEWDWVMSWAPDGDKLLVGTQVQYEVEIVDNDLTYSGSVGYNSIALYDPSDPSAPLENLGSWWGWNDWNRVGLSSDGRYLYVPTRIQDPRSEDGDDFLSTVKIDLTGEDDAGSVPYHAISLSGRIGGGSNPSGWRVNLSAAFGGEAVSQLVYGVAGWATDGRDTDEVPSNMQSYRENELPPLPPVGANDARFLIEDNEKEGSFVDLRSPEMALGDTLAWKLQLFSTSDVVLRWDAKRLNDMDGTFLIREMDDGGDIHSITDMSTVDSLVSEYNDGAPKRSICLYFSSASISVSYTLESGWNMVSVPGQTEHHSYQSMFPGAISLWAWDNEGDDDQYVQADAMAPGRGYWLKLPSDLSRTIPAEEVHNRNVSLPVGWSMTAGFGKVVSVAQLRSAAPQVRSVYGFDGVYYLAEVLEPGEGYWIKVKDAAIALDFKEFEGAPAYAAEKPVLAKTSSLPSLHAITETATIVLQLGATDPELGALPPIPPQGSADARVILADYDSRMSPAASDTYPVRFQEVRELMWDFGPSQDGLWSLELADGRTLALEGKGSASLGTGVVHGLLHQAKRVRAVSYELTGNYPNPFNPTTTVGYQLGAAGLVQLEIFNVLGQRVRLLVDADQAAGVYRVIWDGRDDNGVALAAGTYLLRMHSGAFLQTRKMVLSP